jgi:hypothetical protein
MLCGKKLYASPNAADVAGRLLFLPGEVCEPKDRIRGITRRSRGISLAHGIEELCVFLRGRIGYFRLIETLTILKELDSWIRRRLRCFMVK